MARRIDFERNALNRKSRYGLSIKDESEFRSTDLAARWLKSAEQRNSLATKESKPAKPKPLKAKTKKQVTFYKTFEDIPNDDPHAQLVGTDMSKPPW